MSCSNVVKFGTTTLRIYFYNRLAVNKPTVNKYGYC